MPEDAPVNIGALLESRFRARQRVLEMQTKLHSWAINDHDRRFGDLYNLVYDPAFLVMACKQTRSNPDTAPGGRSQGCGKVLM
ncbi:hypothetical protein [Saccharopolyspora pogona]|uniref:hypothetical protein n=1 Tax=Saccharopolyspora pogona TaxID=333966 RepID=UPI0016872D30|nr:hypothetical protein [Saccharopolyspora pogona]